MKKTWLWVTVGVSVVLTALLVLAVWAVDPKGFDPAVCKVRQAGGQCYTRTDLLNFAHPDWLDEAPADVVVEVDLSASHGWAATDAGLTLLDPFPELRSVRFDHSGVTDAGLPHLARFTQLRDVNLQETRVTDAGLSVLVPLTKLRKLTLWGTGVSDAGLAALPAFPELRSLNVGNTRITDRGLKELTKYPGLWELDLFRSDQLTGEGLKDLSGLTSLRVLHLDSKRLTPAGVKAITNLEALEELHLFWSPVTDEEFAALKRMPKMRSVRHMEKR